MCDQIVPINGGRVKFANPATDYTNIAVRSVGNPLYTVTKTFTPTPLIRAYFSRKNIEFLQNSLRKRIYDLSKGQFKLGKQSETDLVVVMRSVFCMFGRNLCGCDVESQVRQLDGEVLAMIVPNVMTRVKNYVKYRLHVDASLENKRGQMDFMDRGVSTSGPGRKVLSYPLF